jgi:hypothetical protein
MPDHKLGSSYSFQQLVKAYNADPPGDDDAHYLLHHGDEILALCLRYKFNPKPGEVWVGDSKAVTEWGARLAMLKEKKTVPVYYSPRSRTLYEFKGHYAISDDTTDPKELAKRRGPVPLSRIIFVAPVSGGLASPSQKQ